jgi:hypothetical protein
MRNVWPVLFGCAGVVLLALALIVASVVVLDLLHIKISIKG